jgi:hypothetical protein
VTLADAHASLRPSPVHRRITRCRACDAESLSPVLDLGLQPLANALPASPEEFPGEARFPLVLCHCITCGLLQLVDVIDPEVLFGHYLYVTGTSTTIAEHNVRYAAAVRDVLGLRADDLVVEVASNDGSLLRCFQALGVRVLGIEPARNIAEIARERGVPTESVFFDREAGAALRASAGPARAVIGNNVLAHVGDPVGFLAGAAALLAPDGRVIVEVPYLEEMLDRLEYDTIYHEHLCYFSVGSLLTIAERAGLRVVRVDRVPVHGGSIRVWMARADAVPGHAREVLAMVDREREAGLADPARLARFAEDVARNRREVVALLRRLRQEGATVAGYGAPAKGNTLLNYCGIDTDLLAYTVDRSPLKQHRYTPGTHLPILPPEVLLERQPDYVLILAWNFADEIIEQQDEYRRRGGRFILPVPEPVIRS